MLETQKQCFSDKQKKAGKSMIRMHYGDSGCSMEVEEYGESRREQAIDSEMSDFIGSLYQENYPKLLSHVLKRGYHFSVAEDIVHDAYFEAVRHPEKIKGHPNPVGWLMDTVNKKLLAFNRRLERLDPRDWAVWENDLLDLENDYGVTELNMLLEHILDPHERRLFRMYFLQGYSAKELAEQEHITENNFKVKMHRIRTRLEKVVRKDI